MEYPKNIKWTKQRKCVYHVLSEAMEPLSAHQIYNLVLKQTSEETYALSTIYRILATFEENGLVSSTTWMGDDTVVYELERGEHRHYAVCLECHKRIPLETCPFALSGILGDAHENQSCQEHHEMHDHSHGSHSHDHGTKAHTLHDFTVTGHKIELYGYCKDCQAAR